MENESDSPWGVAPPSELPGYLIYGGGKLHLVHAAPARLSVNLERLLNVEQRMSLISGVVEHVVRQRGVGESYKCSINDRFCFISSE